MKTAYYPYADLLKFVCCCGVVAIHTQPHYHLPTLLRDGVDNILQLCVPIFFTVSAYLLARRLGVSDNEWEDIRKFLKRLAILFLVWAVIMSPDWLSAFIMQNPDDWGELLLTKVLTGGPHGGWFVVSLIYGTPIVYVFNKILGKAATSVLFFALAAYVPCVDEGLIPDLLKLHSMDAVVDIQFSCLIALPYIQLGFLLCQSKTFHRASACLIKAARGRRKSALLIVVSLCIPVFTPSFIRPVCSIITEFVIVALCLEETEKAAQSSVLVTLRKMSIMVFFMQFAWCSFFGFLSKHGYIACKFGPWVFLITLAACSLIAFIIVKLSQRYKILRYLY